MLACGFKSNRAVFQEVELSIESVRIHLRGAQGPRWPVQGLNSAIDACYRADEWQRALKFFSAMQALNDAVQDLMRSLD